jgi:CheY-like chemotaxis protein
LGNGLLFLGDTPGRHALGYSILLVDDNRVLRKVLRRMFETVGFLCSESEDGQQAVVEAGRFKPDLIVLGYSMPVMNGLEAAPLLRKLLPCTPIIKFTMFPNKVFDAQAIAAGVTTVVAKDQAATHLLPKAESLLKSTRT